MHRVVVVILVLLAVVIGFIAVAPQPGQEPVSRSILAQLTDQRPEDKAGASGFKRKLNKLNLMQAPEPDGWFTGTATKGSFTVRLPMPSVDMSIEEFPATAPPRRADVLMCVTREFVKLMAVQLAYRRPGDARSIFDSMKGEGWWQRLFRKEQDKVKLLTVAGREALETSERMGKYARRARVILDGEEVFLLVAEWADDQKTAADAVVAKFFESLSINR